MAKAGKKVAVTRAAVIQRVNRKLAHDREQLRATRSERARSSMGDYYVIDTERNVMVSDDVDPIALARELGVLKPWESVVEDA
jgi:hypothetical protein